MVAGVVLGLFRAAPVDQLAEDYPKIMEIITELAEKDGKYFWQYPNGLLFSLQGQSL